MGAHSRAELDFERVLSLLKVRPRLLPTPRMKRQQASDLSDSDFFLGSLRRRVAQIWRTFCWHGQTALVVTRIGIKKILRLRTLLRRTVVSIALQMTPIDRRLKRLAQYSFGVKYVSQRSKFP